MAASGGVIDTKRGSVVFHGRTTFINNTARIGGAIYTAYDQILFNGTTSFINNMAHENGGALYILGTRVVVQGDVFFTLNSANNGGAMYLTTATTLSFGASGARLVSSYNSAYKYGGAIYHEDNTVTLVQCSYFDDSIDLYEQLPYCFLDVDRLQLHQLTFEISSYYDSAGRDGSFMYGGC